MALLFHVNFYKSLMLKGNPKIIDTIIKVYLIKEEADCSNWKVQCLATTVT